MNILLAEDEPKIASFLKKGLEESAYNVDWVKDGKEAIRKGLESEYDVIILDVMLPHIDGFQVCRRIRVKKLQVPILMLTALDSTEDKIKGLDAGADDYIPKPFDFEELLARLRALTRRSHVQNPEKQAAEEVISIENLVCNLSRKEVKRGGKEIKLTAREFELLVFFIKNKNHVLDRATIAAQVWDISFDTGTNVVDVYVNYLRNKIDKDFDKKLIHTRIGLGYIMSTES
ncbi:MAG: DNA-binding response regulator [Cytophagales bacterium]|nr:MAG: DNA-binding response regulator [Cytophagales bacterium]